MATASPSAVGFQGGLHANDNITSKDYGRLLGRHGRRLSQQVAGVLDKYSTSSKLSAMPFTQERYARALEFAARAHGEQKTPTGLPYIVHVVSVAMEVMAALQAEPGHDEDLAITCALLHDVVEDTPTTLAQVEAAFGEPTAAGVAALTKDSARERTNAMRDSLERIMREPAEIAMVKLADRATNMAPPPRHWTDAKITAYRAEAELILTTLGTASPTLAARLRERISRYPAGR